MKLKHLLFVRTLESKVLKVHEEDAKLEEYDKKGDLDEHVQLVNEQLSYFSTDDASKCKLFVLTLIRSPQMWFNGLIDGSIDSWEDFCVRFYVHFTARKDANESLLREVKNMELITCIFSSCI